MTLDTNVAMEQFRKRKAENDGKQIMNSTLPAGSPMYYYCKCCGVQTQVLPELHMSVPITRCDACDVLVKHGLHL